MPATLLQSQLESLHIDEGEGIFKVDATLSPLIITDNPPLEVFSLDSENQILATNNPNSILFSFVNLQLEVNNSKSAMADQTNGVTLNENQRIRKEETLYDVLHRSVSMILPDASSTESAPLLQRIKISVSENGPRLGEASRNTGQTLLRWTRRGSPLRALLVISIGSVAFLALTGLLTFMLIFLVATVNAIIVSLLISLAAAGGFLFFSLACVTAIYIGAMSIAALVISIATISAIFAAMIAADIAIAIQYLSQAHICAFTAALRQSTMSQSSPYVIRKWLPTRCTEANGPKHEEEAIANASHVSKEE
ncbi:hypothetical protein Gotur_012429 [Gossypium turneri]